MPRWDASSRHRQAELCRQQQPWLQSTGPRTTYGRSISSRNAKRRRNVGFVSFPETFENAEENLLECQVCVTHFSQGDMMERLQIGAHVTYIGGYEPTVFACGDEALEVIGFDGSAIACRTSAGQLIWIYAEDLQRCLDGQMKHGSVNRS